MRVLFRHLILGLSLLFIAPTLFAEVVNLNKADAETLQKHLRGIGPVRSQAIVDYRKKHGPYKTLDDLLKVKGIGPKTLEKNKNSLSLSKGVRKTDPADQSTHKRQKKQSTSAEKSTKTTTSKDEVKSSEVKKTSTTGAQKSNKDRPKSAEVSDEKQKFSKYGAKDQKTTDKKDHSKSKKSSTTQKSEKKKKSTSEKR